MFEHAANLAILALGQRQLDPLVAPRPPFEIGVDLAIADPVDLDPLDDLDISWLVTAVFRHQNETGSEVAGRILSDWQYSVPQFVKVMPRDYKRVLAAIRAAEESGSDIDDAIMAAARG